MQVGIELTVSWWRNSLDQSDSGYRLELLLLIGLDMPEKKKKKKKESVHR